jgi:nicotinamide riboside transporter PnuC
VTHEHWLIWIAAAIVFILALAAIGYLSAPECF